MEPTALSLIVIRSANLEAALSFYQALGLDFIEEQHGAGPIHYSCELGNIVLELYPAKNGPALEPQPVDSTMLGFKIASLEATLEKLKALGATPKTAPRDSAWGRWVNIADPDGRVIQLTEAAN